MAAGQAAMITTLTRLEKIVQDDSRWSVEDAAIREGHLKSLLETQVKLTQAQHNLTLRSSRPSSILKPKIGINEQGLWMAIFESPSLKLQPIIGIGATPEEAVDNFDRTFKGLNVTYGGHLMAMIEASGAMHQQTPEATPPVEETPPPKKRRRTRKPKPAEGGKDGEVK